MGEQTDKKCANKHTKILRTNRLIKDEQIESAELKILRELACLENWHIQKISRFRELVNFENWLFLEIRNLKKG